MKRGRGKGIVTLILGLLVWLAVSLPALAECPTGDLGSALGSPVVTGSTIGASDSYSSPHSCGDAGERAYSWIAPYAGSYQFDTNGSNYDTELYIRSTDCNGSELGYNDDYSSGLLSRLTLSLSSGQTIMIFVDGCGETGNFQLNIAALTPAPPSCGGIPADDPNVCGGNGACVDVDTCVCLFGWGGPGCDIPTQPVVLNEVYYDSFGTDVGSFTEIIGPARLDLTGYVVIGVNGNGNTTYQPIDLTGHSIPDDGYFVIGQDANVTTSDMTNTDVNWQNGEPDAVQLMRDGTVVDAVCYGGYMAVGCEGNYAPDVEGASLARRVNGFDTDDNARDFYGTTTLTPGAPNPDVIGLPTWCRLQWPLDMNEPNYTDHIFYGHLYEAGITTLTDGTDANPYVVGQVGFGPRNSYPVLQDTLWTWTDAVPNPGWSGSAAGEGNNDEYMAEVNLSFDVGDYDFAFRFSLDAGHSWLYCDRNAGGGSDGSEDGYQTANAGKLTLTENLDPCLPDPCNGHGSCADGLCTCDNFWMGEFCDISDMDDDGIADEDDVCPEDAGNDVDQDGFCAIFEGEIYDCDDNPEGCGADCYPGATELCDEYDNNCDGSNNEDFPMLGDPCFAGLGVCESEGVLVCSEDGTDVACNAVPDEPLSEFDTTCDGVDDNCNGMADENYEPETTTCGIGACETDGLTSCENGDVVDGCVPDEPLSEFDTTCDGVDDNCNGMADENYEPETTTCGVGACATDGLTSCENGDVVDHCVPDEPLSELDTTCDGVDDNCNGMADENYEPETTTCGIGACETDGLTSCENGDVVDGCVPDEPLSEFDTTCDGVDDNCNGMADENYEPETTTCGIGACETDGLTSCENGDVVDGCVPDEPLSEFDTTCDGVDDNCNGMADENYEPETTTCGIGACETDGLTSCENGDVVDGCVPGEPAGTDLCDGIDGNCNGIDDVDEAELADCGAHGQCVSADGSTFCDCDDDYFWTEAGCVQDIPCQGQADWMACNLGGVTAACFDDVCEALADADRCSDAITLTVNAPYQGDLGAAHPYLSLDASCLPDGQTVTGADQFFVFNVDAGEMYDLEIVPNSQALGLALAILTDCESGSSCLDEALVNDNPGEGINLTGLTSPVSATVYLQLMATESTEDGTYTLTVRASSDVDGDEDGDVDGDVDGDEDGDEDGDIDGDEDGDVDGDEDGDVDGDEDGDVDVTDDDDDVTDDDDDNDDDDDVTDDDDDVTDDDDDDDDTIIEDGEGSGGGGCAGIPLTANALWLLMGLALMRRTRRDRS